MPLLIQIFLRHPPEPVGIAHRRKQVVSLHPVIPVVGAELEKLRQILVPGVQIHRRGPLAHSQLIHRHRRIVYQAHPADHAAGRPVKAADGAARRPHLTEIEAHAAAELAHLGEVVHTAVNPVQAVRHHVDKAAGKLVKGLSGVGQGGSGHGGLLKAQHVVKPPGPAHPLLFLFPQGQVEGDPQIHLLRRLQNLPRPAADHVPVQQKLQSGVGKQPVSLLPDPLRRLRKLLSLISF